MTLRVLPFAVAVACATAALPAAAAESLDGCTGFIDALPATITKQGTWCLRAGLTTAIASGNAITVGASSVTIDCNDYRLLGTATPASTTAVAIAAAARTNVTVRNCRIEGFDTGISLTGPYGHTVVDNHLQSLRSIGIAVTSTPGRVEGNRVSDVGVFVARSAPRGIVVSGDVDVLDNSVDHVIGSNASSRVTAIMSQSGQSNVVAGNRVSETVNVLGAGTTGVYIGSGNAASRTVARDNTLLGTTNAEPGIALVCASAKNTTRANMIAGWPAGLSPNCRSHEDVVAAF